MRFLALLIASLPAVTLAETIHVGPSDGYRPIEAAKAGDRVLLAPGTYRFRVHLRQRGTSSQPIVIEAEDPSSRPIWDLSGKRVDRWPGSDEHWAGEHACWAISGAHYVLSGLEITGCRTDQHPVGGIYLDYASDITLRDLWLHHNDQGLQGYGDNIVIEHADIGENGDAKASHHKTHNVYFTGGSIEIRASYVHDSRDGVNLKLDAWIARLEGNLIADGNAGTLAMETMNQGCGTPQRIVMRGNVVLGSSEATEIWLRNAGAGPNLEMTLDAAWNTFVLNGPERALVQVYDDGLEDAHLSLDNNIIAGTNIPFALSRPERAGRVVRGTNNLVEEGAEVGPLRASVRAVPSFAQDYALADGSPGKDLADLAVPDPPRLQIQGSGPHLRSSTRDLGAVELGGAALTPGDGLLPKATAVKTLDLPTCGCACSGGNPDGSWLVAAFLVYIWRRTAKSHQVSLWRPMPRDTRRALANR